MCDIGRFEYHWIEGDAASDAAVRSRRRRASRPPPGTPAIAAATRPALGAGRPAPAAADAALPALGARLARGALRRRAARAARPRRRARRRASHVTWTTSDKPQPAGSQFTVPAVNAPNVAGARLLGLTSAGPGEAADASALRADVEAGRVSTLFVLDPGPAGLARRRRLDYRGAHVRQARRRSSSKACSSRRWRRPPTSCCPAPAGWRRTPATPTRRAGCRPPRASFRRRARRSRTRRSCCGSRRHAAPA